MTELHDDLVTLTNAFIDLQNALSVIPAAEILAQKLLLTFWKLFSYFSLHATDGIDGQTDIRTECNAYRGVLTGGLTNNGHSLT